MSLINKIASSTTIETIRASLLQALPLARRDRDLQREMATWFIGLADVHSPGPAWYLGAVVTALVVAGKVLEEDEQIVKGKEDGGEMVERVCKVIENGMHDLYSFFLSTYI